MNFICFDTEDDSKELCALQKCQWQKFTRDQAEKYCELLKLTPTPDHWRRFERRETISGFDKKLTQIAAITAEGKHYYSKGDVPHFLKWLERQPEVYVYSLNIAYDLGNLFANKLDALDVIMVGGRMIRANWHKKIFVDVFNIWPMGVAKLGEAFGLKKLTTESMATDRAYVMRDVEIIRAAMLFAWKFAQESGLDRLPATLGGLCVRLWQHWGGENSHDSNELSREALFGGRVELFKAHNDSQDVCWTDINSLYPSVMIREFPACLEDYGTELAPYGVARVRVKLPQSDLCILPYRNDEGRIFYPWGTFEGCWTVAELRAAEKRGAKILEVFECLGTTATETPYKDFVLRCYDLRLRSNSPAESLLWKLCMNNLYGRMGASGTITRSVWQTEDNCADGQPYGDKLLSNYQLPLSKETNWCHAAHVTAYGRLELLQHMELIGAEKMIYCDTDSTIFDRNGGKIPFPISTKLGEMKIVHRCVACGDEEHKPIAGGCSGGKLADFWFNCVPYAPKLYRVGNKHKAKGIPQRLAKQYIETGKASFDLPFKFREAARFYDRGNSHKLSVWREVTKEKRSTYDRKQLKQNRYFPCKLLAK